MTTSTDAQHAAESGADAIGLNFYPRSPRCVPASTVETILEDLPIAVDTVGVFVGEPFARIC
ncbi:MAG TPA: phosphoribosylanthranilate isomerase, partial [Gemmataceae bacterium]|nr:phosphoribosylanthranilate isomerase [Gemmataceae bacterium]